MSVTAEDLIKHLASKVAASLSGGEAPAKTGQVLLDVNAVREVFGRFFAEKGNNPFSDDQIRAACEATKKQVGEVNYHNWRSSGDFDAYIRGMKDGLTANREGDPAFDEQGNPVETVGKPVVPDLAGGYEKEAETMGKRVTALEWKLAQLDTGHGAKGAAAKLGIGLAGLEATVIGGVDTAKTALETPTDFFRKKPEKSEETKEKAKEVSHELVTTIKTALGEYQAVYDKTRPAYEKYSSARKKFAEARRVFLDRQGELNEESTNANKAMNEAFDAMRAADADYESEVSGIGLDEKLKLLNEWSEQTSSGAAGSAMEIGVDAMGGALAGTEEGAADEVGSRVTQKEADEAEKKAEELLKNPIRDKAVEAIKDQPKEQIQAFATDKGKDAGKTVLKEAAGIDLDARKKKEE